MPKIKMVKLATTHIYQGGLMITAHFLVTF